MGQSIFERGQRHTPHRHTPPKSHEQTKTLSTHWSDHRLHRPTLVGGVRYTQRHRAAQAQRTRPPPPLHPCACSADTGLSLGRAGWERETPTGAEAAERARTAKGEGLTLSSTRCSAVKRRRARQKCSPGVTPKVVAALPFVGLRAVRRCAGRPAPSRSRAPAQPALRRRGLTAPPVADTRREASRRTSATGPSVSQVNLERRV